MLIEFEVHLSAMQHFLLYMSQVGNTKTPKTMLTGYVGSAFPAIWG